MDAIVYRLSGGDGLPLRDSGTGVTAMAVRRSVTSMIGAE
jgi:hypothetical protein